MIVSRSGSTLLMLMLTGGCVMDHVLKVQLFPSVITLRVWAACACVDVCECIHGCFNIFLHMLIVFFLSYRDAEKNFHNISNRCSYADHSNKEEIEDVSGILQCTANILGISTIYLYG